MFMGAKCDPLSRSVTRGANSNTPVE